MFSCTKVHTSKKEKNCTGIKLIEKKKKSRRKLVTKENGIWHTSALSRKITWGKIKFTQNKFTRIGEKKNKQKRVKQKKN